MTDSSSLTPIEVGDLADSQVLQNNFTYLDNRITNLASTISNVENKNNKDKPSGYCGLDSSGKISSSNIPSSYLDSVNSNISSINTNLATKAPLKNPTFTGTVKVPNSTADGTAISLVKRGTHYIQFGDGLKIQWGSDSGDKWISFPLQYTSYCEVFITDTGSTTTRDVQKVRYKELKRFYSWTSGSDDSFCWFAIGR